ncbi:MAG: hypothetical protein GXP49_18380 [Deltaproteobacteria bacterium]|nr:hypothetical protein [Deltaproteobacteria bacterium]
MNMVTRLKSCGLFTLFSLALLIGSAPCRAADSNKSGDEEVFVEKSAYGPVQKRVFALKQELSLGWAYLPLDAYYKGYGAQIAYTVHFDNTFALELFRVGWSYNKDTKLKTRLIEQMPDVSPTEFPAIVFFENTDLIMKILYGKQSLLNSFVLHYEIFVAAGVTFEYLNSDNITHAKSDKDYNRQSMFHFGINAGMGFRLWFSPKWSFVVDLRDNLALLSFTEDEFPLKNAAMLGISIAVNL